MCSNCSIPHLSFWECSDTNTLREKAFTLSPLKAFSVHRGEWRNQDRKSLKHLVPWHPETGNREPQTPGFLSLSTYSGGPKCRAVPPEVNRLLTSINIIEIPMGMFGAPRVCQVDNTNPNNPFNFSVLAYSRSSRVSTPKEVMLTSLAGEGDPWSFNWALLNTAYLLIFF